MRFLRQVVVIAPGWASVPSSKTLHGTDGDLELVAQHLSVEGKAKEDWVLVRASLPLKALPRLNAAREVVIEEAIRKRLERSIESFADMVAVANRCARSISSLHPWAALIDLSEDDRKHLSTAVGFDARRMAVRQRIVEAVALDDPALLQIGADRPDGVALMAEGLSASHETGQFHEYIRVFERAFRLGPTRLIRPLTTFLQGVPALGYSPNEIHNWLGVLRALATHADRRDTFATASDIGSVVGRVEQAAYDVLFNKKNWRSPDPERRVAHAWLSGVTAKGLFLTQNTTPVMTAQLLDGYGTFPMYLGGPTSVPDDWWTGTQESEST